MDDRVRVRPSPAVLFWLDRYCPSVDGHFLFLDPISWQSFELTEGAVIVLREAASAIEQERFNDFLFEVREAGGWPPGLEFLVRALTELRQTNEFPFPE